MGFYLANPIPQGQKRTASVPLVRPTLLHSAISSGQETHTPAIRMQERGQRFNNPETGRWLSRDPIQERGGANLYGFVRNAPTDLVDLFGLLVRSDVEKGRVLYSCNCGWIDTIHSKGAVPNAAGILGGLVSNLGGTASEITFAISQTFGGLQFGYAINMPQTPTIFTDKDAIEIALGIWMHANVAFESWQGGTGAELLKKSSFSVEDLPSDYLAMMMAVRNRYGQSKGISWPEIDKECHFLDAEDSLWVYDFGTGPTKNYSHIPELWKSKQGLDWCWPCQQIFSPQGLVFPKIPSIFGTYNPAAQVGMFKQTTKKDINPLPGM